MAMWFEQQQRLGAQQQQQNIVIHIIIDRNSKYVCSRDGAVTK